MCHLWLLSEPRSRTWQVLAGARLNRILPSPKNTTQYSARRSHVSQEPVFPLKIILSVPLGDCCRQKAGICSPAPVSYANSQRPAMTMGNFCQRWRRGRALPAFASGQTKEKSSGNKSWHSQERRRRKIQKVLNALVFTV